MKRIDAARQDVHLYIEGEVRNTQEHPQFFEGRIDGPLIRPCGSKDEYAFDVEVNILCTTVLDEKEIYHMQKLLGIASQILNTSIPVFKYGDLQGVDDPEVFIGCLILKGGLEGIHLHHFGQVDDKTQLMQGSGEAAYEMYL